MATVLPAERLRDILELSNVENIVIKQITSYQYTLGRKVSIYFVGIIVYVLMDVNRK